MTDEARAVDPSRADPPAAAEGVRQWCATAFVVWDDRLLLHHHAKLAMWLPCGGHVEPGELPDDAAVREVLEESGVAVELVGEKAIDAPGPVPLVRPRGIQLEPIGPGHEHIDLIYFARPRGPYDGRIPLADVDPTLGWYDGRALDSMRLSAEVRAWCDLALRELGTA